MSEKHYFVAAILLLRAMFSTIDMAYTPRIGSDPAYIQLLGQAFYNFTYLEWVVVSTIRKLSTIGFTEIPKKATAGKVSEILGLATQNATPALPDFVRTELEDIHALFVAAIKTRNSLLHAHPYTATEGHQRLSYNSELNWPLEAVERAAIQFEGIAIKANDIFHGSLSQVRP